MSGWLLSGGGLLSCLQAYLTLSVFVQAGVTDDLPKRVLCFCVAMHTSHFFHSFTLDLFV